MSDVLELKDDELDKVAGGGTGSMQEVYDYANRLFLEVLIKGGNVDDLNKVMDSVNEMIVRYSTLEGKIMMEEKPMIEAQIQGLYSSFFNQLK